MIRSILLVMDGQPATHGSIDLSVRLASEFGAVLVGMGVLDEAVIHPAEAVPLGAGQAKVELDAARQQQLQQVIEKSLFTVAKRCASEHVAFKHFERMGRLADEIILEAQSFDLVVMPRFLHDAGGAVEESIGKALRAILRAAPRPVIAVAEKAVKKDAVVVAYDGSLQAARTLQLFAATGLAGKRAVHVVSIDDDLHEARLRGDRAVDFLAHHALRATLHAEPRTADPAEQLLEFAGQLDAGLVVMGAYGQPRIREFVLGSVTQSMLRRCPISLFLYH